MLTDLYFVVRTLPDGSKHRVSDLLSLEAAEASRDRLNGDSENPEFSVHPAQPSAQVDRTDQSTEG